MEAIIEFTPIDTLLKGEGRPLRSIAEHAYDIATGMKHVPYEALAYWMLAAGYRDLFSRLVKCRALEVREEIEEATGCTISEMDDVSREMALGILRIELQPFRTLQRIYS